MKCDHPWAGSLVYKFTHGLYKVFWYIVSFLWSVNHMLVKLEIIVFLLAQSIFRTVPLRIAHKFLIGIKSGKFPQHHFDILTTFWVHLNNVFFKTCSGFPRFTANSNIVLKNDVSFWSHCFKDRNYFSSNNFHTLIGSHHSISWEYWS